MFRLLPIILLAACGSMPPQHFTDSTVRGIAPGMYEVEMTVVVASPEKVAELCGHWLPTGSHALGCALTLPGYHKRTVVIPRLRDANDINTLATIGHEFLHGVFGDWHAQ